MAKLVLGGDNNSATPAFITLQEKEVPTKKFGLDIDYCIPGKVVDGVYVYDEESSTKPIHVNCQGITRFEAGFPQLFQYSHYVESVNLQDLQILDGSRTFEYLFFGCVNLTEINLDSLEIITNDEICNVENAWWGEGWTAHQMFMQTGISTIDLNALHTIHGAYAATRMFNGCPNLTTANLPSLTTVDGGAAANSLFGACPNLKTINMPNLRTIKGDYAGFYMFESTGLETYTFESLEEVTGEDCLMGLFYLCQEIQSVYFPQLTTISPTAFNQAFYESSISEIHFRTDMQETVENLSGYDMKFGASNAEIIFDL
jgi:hypothetical protein